MYHERDHTHPKETTPCPRPVANVCRRETVHRILRCSPGDSFRRRKAYPALQITEISCVKSSSSVQPEHPSESCSAHSPISPRPNSVLPLCGPPLNAPPSIPPTSPSASWAAFSPPPSARIPHARRPFAEASPTPPPLSPLTS